MDSLRQDIGHVPIPTPLHFTTFHIPYLFPVFGPSVQVGQIVVLVIELQTFTK